MAGRFPSAWLDELRARADIVQVVSSYVPLKRNGHRYWGLCPFHNEKTASFSVDAEHQLYYCFGCKAGGSVIQFIMEMERLDFQEAVVSLADRLHMPLPEMKEDPDYQKKKSQRERLYAANKLAAQFYNGLLYQKEGEAVLSYLKKRGLDDAAIRKFGLGASPPEWDTLTRHLQDQGFTLDELRAAGLTVVKEKGAYDMFRNRAMFPIIDLNGNVLGFGGRAMGDAMPKYLNTQDTPVFNKRLGVYAANLLKKTRNLSRVVLVEGYMDVAALIQFGVEGVVATLGTSLTNEQARFIKRFAPQVYVAYDGDSAGQHAILRALDIFESEAIPAKVLVFPDKLDPDEFIRRDGLEAFTALNPMNAAQYRMLQKQQEFDLTTQDGRTEYAKACALILKKVTEPVEMENHLTYLMMQTGFTREVLAAQIGLPHGQMAKHIYSPRRESLEKTPQVTENVRTQQVLLSILAAGKLQEGVVTEELFTDPVLKSLAQGLIQGSSPAALIEAAEQRDRAQVTELLMARDNLDRDSALKMAQQCINRLNIAQLEERIERLKSLIGAAPPKEKQAMAGEIITLSKRLEQLKSVSA